MCERRLRRQWQRRLNSPDEGLTDARIMLFGTDITSLALFGVERQEEREDGLSGSAVSPGSYTGRARVVHEIAEADALEREEILVVRQVTPAWAPLLARVGAVVADVGGALSHGSVVAREYGIPAVMGVRTATSRIVTGNVLTVDGDSGTVRLLGEA
ncbi:Phosphoenolpyruvate synthase OS=Streptomyces tendae OX=1932 GN=GUR47_28005 PE=4 SV=1 [Streptomyces tendae]